MNNLGSGPIFEHLKLLHLTPLNHRYFNLRRTLCGINCRPLRRCIRTTKHCRTASSSGSWRIHLPRKYWVRECDGDNASGGCKRGHTPKGSTTRFALKMFPSRNQHRLSVSLFTWRMRGNMYVQYNTHRILCTVFLGLSRWRSSRRAGVEFDDKLIHSYSRDQRSRIN